MKKNTLLLIFLSIFFSQIIEINAQVNVTSIERHDPMDSTTEADQVTFRVTFDTPVKNVDVTDFALSGTIAADGTISSISPVSDSVYDVIITGITNSEGTINLNIKGNGGTASTNDIIVKAELEDISVTGGANTIDRTEWGQSFEAGLSGELKQIALLITQGYNGNFTMELRQGEGLSGTVLATETVNVTGLTGEQFFTFSTPATIASGSQYTLRFTTSSPSFDQELVLRAVAGNPLSSGVIYQPTALSNFDLYLKTIVDTGVTPDPLTATSPGTDETYTIVNPPVASNLAISGDLVVGEQLTGSYTYNDPQSDTESGSTFKWYRADDASGTNKATIAGAIATTYTLTNSDLSKFISFEVTPSDGTNTGATVESSVSGPVKQPLVIQSIVRQTPTDEKISSGTNPVFRVTFSDDVRNVTTDDFILNTTSGGSINTLNKIDASTYDVSITGLTNTDGTVTLKVKGVDGAPGTNNITEDIDTSFSNGIAAHQQTTENDYLNQDLIGQSFSATSNNFLTAFTLFKKSGNHTFTGTAKLRIFQGDASNSAVLNDASAVVFNGTVNISDDTGATGQTITVATPPQLSMGTTYSIVLDNFTGTGSHAFFAHTSGSLANGRAFFTGSNNTSHAAFDFMINIFEGTKITAQPLNTTAPTTKESYSVQAIDQTIAFSATSSNGAESVVSSNIQVALSAAEGLDVSVDYAITGTATAGGTDFTLANGTLTITAGNTTNNITIPSIIDDALRETDETIIITLSNPVNATLGTNTVHTYTINDNDNTAPVASNVNFSGTLEVGETLTGTYIYTDANNDTESGSTYKWYISDDASGTNKSAIATATATTYVLTTNEVGKFISFEVTPNDGAVAGTTVESSIQGTVKNIQTITFNSLTSKTYGDSNFNLNATASSSLNVTYVSSNTSVATVSGNTVTIVGEGMTNITASQAGNATFVAASDIVQPLSVAKKNITVTANSGLSKTYGDTDPTLGYSITSGSLVSGDSFSGALTRTTGENAGTYPISIGTLALSTNYNLSFVSDDFTIHKKDITVTANSGLSKTYGDADPTLGYSVTSGSLVSGDSFSGDLFRTAGENAGTYPISIGTLALNNNYNLSFVSGDFTIHKKDITVTADAKSKVYGQTDPTLTYQITTASLETGDVLAGSLSRTAGEAVGTYPISSSLLNANYNITFVPADLTITQKAITITADAKSKVYGDTDPALTYQITTGSLETGDVLAGSLSRTAGEAVGKYPISSSLSNANYNITFVPADLTITKANQIITFNPLIHADDVFDLVATSTSGLTISYTSSNLDVATISGKTVTIIGAGETIITASQAGNTNFNAAMDVSQTLAITALSTEDFILNSKKVLLYPNPSVSKLKIRLGTYKADLNIFDINGKLIRTLKAYKTDNAIDISRLKAGVYIIRITKENKMISKRFIKE